MPAPVTPPEPLPSLGLLQRHLGQQVLLCAPGLEPVPATVHRAGAGVPMSPRFHCYTAEFLLEPGVQLPQAVYRLQIGQAGWPLLMTPVGFAMGRRSLLEAVIHTDQHLPEMASHE